ncbi:class I SAM-dependent methyltransferase [Ruegeria sp. 2205SS24-7]|uniref:class I SAM-dependent methyltransferase n=1 Tax=Ruegeria discodermiae TaxID=3064389 RepID=UPI0027406710|nr:class I SAM-dependent methyltransferase [Ruegeria sp. 2205SS24-7]MDP5218689.1 class I SAM-dependent methyltransferase [Ruegeria sp. 2205SS24-7]
MKPEGSTSVAGILAAYDKAADTLAEQLEELSTAAILQPVAGFLPKDPARVLDVGAGSGRDAAWFAGQRHQVWAAEPVDSLRHAARDLHESAAITWLDDGLPNLRQSTALGMTFDLVLLNAVWHHVPPALREASIASLAGLTGPGGRLIMSLREGPSDPARPAFPAAVDKTIAQAEAQQLRLLRRSWVEAVQPENRRSGVIFTWLVFQRE